ncbi:MAG TPA: signal peptide peptidase SppA [Chitinivibrionales bacterium]
MTKGQKLTIGGILILPILIGVVVSALTSETGSLKLSGLSTKRIGLAQISDVIYSSEEYVRQLRDLREDADICGVILRIDSPGGAVAPSQEIYEEVMRFREANKPVVVSMGNLAASGGYYIASPAFKIFANPGTITGSIGVIMSFTHYYKLLDKIGVDFQVLKAGELKDVGNPNRAMTLREKQYMQTMLDDVHMQFIEDVGRARGISMDSLIPIADGRIFTGRQAVEARLVDTLGGFEDAVAYIKNHCNVPEKSTLVEKKRPEGFLKRLLTEELFNKIPLLKGLTSPGGSYFLFDMSPR